MRRVVMVTGLQAAGKSTVAPMLARRLGPPAVSFDGDVLYTSVVSGHATMTEQPTPEAELQLSLRYRGAALLAQLYAEHGFDFVYSDIVLGGHVEQWLESIRNAHRHLVVLAPRLEVVAARERARGTDSYQGWLTGGGSLSEAVESLAAGLAEIPRRGLWIDTSELSAAETVEQILADDLRASRW